MLLCTILALFGNIVWLRDLGRECSGYRIYSVVKLITQRLYATINTVFADDVLALKTGQVYS